MTNKSVLQLRKLGIDTYKEAVIYMRQDCHICLSEGFEAHTRLRVSVGERSIIATLNIINSDILEPGKAGLSCFAWDLLSAKEDDEIHVAHARPVKSQSYLRSKIYGKELTKDEINHIVRDITAGRYSDIYLSSFLTACAGGRLTLDETVHLTQAMVDVGDQLSWHSDMIVDKHCVGGLPGNRTTPIVVSIVSAFGLTIPKTSSRAITSPSGTADTMEVITPVDIDMTTMKHIVGKENGCIIWGGAASLSPADDLLIRVESALDLDSDGQLVASVLSKKIAAGSTHVLIDIPIGETAKVRNQATADMLKTHLHYVAQRLGINVKVIFSDGSQPVGKGIGPALEARDVIAVLRGDNEAPQDLRQRAIELAGHMLEFSPEVKSGKGQIIAEGLMDSGKAWEKFQSICAAQGGMREIPIAKYTYPYVADKSGTVVTIDNRQLALLAKLAGAPSDKAAGIDMHARINSILNKGDAIFTIHAQSPGELEYAINHLHETNDIIKIV